MISDELNIKIENMCRNNFYSHWEKDFLYEAAEKGLTLAQLEFISERSKTVYEMREIAEGILAGLSMDQVMVYAKKDFNVKDMRLLKDGLLKGQSTEDMKAYGEALKNVRHSLYECAMMQFEMAFAQMEKEQGIKAGKAVKDKAYRDMQLFVSSLESQIPSMISEKTNILTSEAFAFDKDIKNGINDLISNAEKKMTKSTASKAPLHRLR